jgi:hypothetical protein
MLDLYLAMTYSIRNREDHEIEPDFDQSWKFPQIEPVDFADFEK